MIVGATQTLYESPISDLLLWIAETAKIKDLKILDVHIENNNNGKVDVIEKLHTLPEIKSLEEIMTSKRANQLTYKAYFKDERCYFGIDMRKNTGFILFSNTQTKEFEKIISKLNPEETSDKKKKSTSSKSTKTTKSTKTKTKK